MYHFYKLYGDAAYEERMLSSFREEPHNVTKMISTQVTFSPRFFRNELEIGLSVLGTEEGDSPSYGDLMGLDAFVINPLLDLLDEYRKADRIGAARAALEMKEVLQRREACEDFPQRQIELIEAAAGIGENA